MWVSIDLWLVPIGVVLSLSPYIKACLSIIEEYKLEYELGPNGTAIEGECDQFFECIQVAMRYFIAKVFLLFIQH